jgi:membrane-associated protease RseP (regulator of RpoE activity)
MYKLNLFPVGGYVKLVGENDHSNNSVSNNESSSFFRKAKVLVTKYYRRVETYEEVDISAVDIGMGKVIFQRPVRGVIHRVHIVPVKILISLVGEELNTNDDQYRTKPLWKKSIILLAGIGMNVLLAIFLFHIYISSSSFTVDLPKITDHDFVGTKEVLDIEVFPVSEVMSGYAADGHITAGDIILQLDGEYLEDSAELISKLNENQEKTVTIGLNTGIEGRITSVDKEVEIYLPRKTDDEPLLGAAYAPTPVYILEYEPNVISSISHSWTSLLIKSLLLSRLLVRLFPNLNPDISQIM